MRAQKTFRKTTSYFPQERPVCTIYKVHKHLRSVSDKAYDPQVISIGPYHHGKENLNMMEKQKMMYMCSLHEGKDENFGARIFDTIQLLESKSRECYAEDIDDVPPSKFTEMLLLDGCFIIQLLRNFSKKNPSQNCTNNHVKDPTLIPENDPIFQMGWIRRSLRHDLMLFENQIPFFILLELFNLVEGTNQQGDNLDLTHPKEKDEELMELLSRFFESSEPGKGYKKNDNRKPRDIKHLLDLVHSNWLPPPKDSSSQVLDVNEQTDEKKQLVAAKKGANHMRYINTAKELKDANVRFVKSKKEINLFEVTFKKGIMTMSTFSIGDATESFLRNLIVYEQYFQDHKTSFVTDYVLFLDFLIDTPKDVEILSGANIIDNWLGDDEVTANMINKLADWITSSSTTFAYAEILPAVNDHCKKRKNRYCAALKQKYLNGPWGTISIMVAVTILLLAGIQTVFSILQQVVAPKKN